MTEQSPLDHDLLPAAAMTQERGCVGTTTQEDTLDDISGHC